MVSLFGQRDWDRGNEKQDQYMYVFLVRKTGDGGSEIHAQNGRHDNQHTADNAMEPGSIIDLVANTFVLVQEKKICIRPDHTSEAHTVFVRPFVSSSHSTSARHRTQSHVIARSKAKLFELTVPTSPEGGITAAPALMVARYLSVRWGLGGGIAAALSGVP